MRILYGVVGEGMGHATRSRVVLDHLIAAGHDVQIVVSGRAHDMLRQHFEGVRKIHGFHLVSEDATVKKTRTAWSNLLGLGDGLPQNVNAWFDLVREFQPEVVISDFESWSYLYAKANRLPVVSIDNMQVINRCRHADDLVGDQMTAFLLAKGIVKAKLPGAYHYVVTTFFYPEQVKERTTLVPPILRPEVLAARATAGDHVLVYQTATGAETLQAVLRSLPDVTFRVYGLRRGIQAEEVDGNLRHQPFSETKFVDDLASARAVVAGGGFSLMGECVYLRKPLLAVPLVGQFEQVLNARYLQKLGYGLCREQVGRADVEELLRRAPEFQANLAGYSQDGNRKLYETVDGLLAAVAEGRAPA